MQTINLHICRMSLFIMLYIDSPYSGYIFNKFGINKYLRHLFLFFQNDSSASVPASGSNALRTSSKTNIHNGNSSSGSVVSNGLGGTTATNGSSSGESKSELRVSCASGISANGNCSAITNGHLNGHSHSLANGHSHSMTNGHSAMNGGSVTTTVVTTTGTLNGRHVLNNEGNNNGSALAINSLSGQPTNGTIRVQSHKLPLLHTTNNNAS